MPRLDFWYFMRFFDLFSEKIQKLKKTVFSQKPRLLKNVCCLKKVYYFIDLKKHK